MAAERDSPRILSSAICRPDISSSAPAHNAHGLRPTGRQIVPDGAGFLWISPRLAARPPRGVALTQAHVRNGIAEAGLLGVIFMIL